MQHFAAAQLPYVVPVAAAAGAAPVAFAAAPAAFNSMPAAFGAVAPAFAAIPVGQPLCVAVPAAAVCQPAPASQVGVLATPEVATGIAGACPLPQARHQEPAHQHGGEQASQRPYLCRAGARTATVQRRLRRQRAARLMRTAAALAAAPEIASARKQPVSDGRQRHVQHAAAESEDTVADFEAEVCSEFVRDLEAGGDARRAAAKRLQGSVRRWSFHPAGCRVVQLALEVCTADMAAAFAAELRGQVREAMESKHANFVLAKIVEVLPVEESAFIAEEMFSFAWAAVRHQYGCRIFCRLIEHAITHPATKRLIENEVARFAGEHSRHEYAHYVVAHALEHGSSEQKRLIVSELLGGDLVGIAYNRYGRFVVEAVFAHGSEEEQLAALALLRSQGDFVGMAMHPNANMAVTAALRSRALGAGLAEARAEIAMELAAAAPRLAASKFGQRALQLVERLRGAAAPASPLAAAAPVA